ncbi:kinase-like domain-containing protein [Xylaria digitata]|nr:kinase-like domain-containing protein [Xylaria digitata]
MAGHRCLFSLVPINERAHEVVGLEHNRGWRAKDLDDKLVLCIGNFTSRSGNATTLATLGHDEKNDIFVDSTKVAKLQCSFEFNSDTNFVMFYDRSHAMTSKVYGPMCHPFEQDRPRKVLVQAGFNEFIGFGGENADFIQFQLRWHQDRVGTLGRAMLLRSIAMRQNANLTETIIDSDSELTSPRVTRVSSIEPERSPIRWLKLGRLGSGSHGEVFQAVNTDDGNLMAVRMMKQRANPRERELRKARWMREVKILSEARHLHIVEYIGARGWDEEMVCIFMGLKEGTLTSVVERGSLPRLELSDIVFNHMLQAIDFLATKNIVHRDIKPDNILYVMRTGRHLFQLGDFGLSTDVAAEASPRGTHIYMAPELLQRGELTHKADVWSLFITMIWISGNQQFRGLCNGNRKSVDRTLEIISECTLSEPEYFERFQEMGRINPQQRPSAAQLLLRCYRGKGLTTPIDLILPLDL